MKKLLTLLLALLLPLCACAETYELSVTVEANEDTFVQLAKEAFLADQKVDTAAVDTYIKLIQKILNGLGLNIAFQEDAVSLEMQLAGGRLLDLIAYNQNGTSCMTSSMFPGYVLVDDEVDTSTVDQALLNELDQTDWDAVYSGIDAGLTEWLSAIEPTVTRGAFDGDAFQGGVVCTTWMLSDMDVAALVNQLMTPDLREILTIMINAMSLDADVIFEQFDAENDRVADEDRYFYVLRAVQDDKDQLIGLSLTILDEDAQVATASLGLGEKVARLVVGLGFKGKNYWWEITANKEQRDQTTQLSGHSREWVADKQDAFTYVSATQKPVSDFSWVCNVTDSAAGFEWDASVAAADAAIISTRGTVTTDVFSLNGKIFLGSEEKSPLALNVSISPAEAIQTCDPSLIKCSMTDPADAETYERLINQISASLLARLMKLLPMDLLLMLNDLTVQ